MGNAKIEVKSSTWGVFRRLYKRFPPLMRKQLWVLLLLMVLKAVFETGTMGVVAFFAAAISNPETVLESPYVITAADWTGMESLLTIKGLIIFLSILVPSMVIVKNVFKSLVTFSTARYFARMEAFLAEYVLKGFLTLPYHWHLMQNSAALVYAIEMRKNIGRDFIHRILKLLSDALMVLIMFLTLLVLQPYVSLFVIILFGGSGYLIYYSIKRVLSRSAKQCKELELKINHEATKAIHGIKDVKINGREISFLSNVKDNASVLSRHFGLYKFLELSPNVILESVGFIMLTASICFMLFYFDESTLKVSGTIALLAVAAWKCLPAIERIIASISVTKYSLPFVLEVIGFMEEIEAHELEQIEEAGEETESPFQRDLVFEDVWFRYQVDQDYLFKEVNLTIRKGETLGIIGNSGAGKSTLVDLIIALLYPQKGRVLIDGVPLGRENLRQWRKRVGYVAQTPYIFDGTLAENIAFGVAGPEMDRAWIEKCCHMASMDDFIHRLSHGIDTHIGERGIRLSGGQQQRVAIARALYHMPEVMIFDEATSSLDTNSERKIKNTIYSLKGERTLIIIAHRLTTVEDCDRVVWLADGKIKKVGRPGEIIAEFTGSAGVC